MGCVFVKDEGKDSEEIVAKAHNLTNITKNASAHCEINCINELTLRNSDPKSITSRCTLYVTCEPCMMCAHALNLAQVQRVVFGCHNDKFGGNGSILSIHKHP